jgi:hypothetical protein
MRYGVEIVILVLNSLLKVNECMRMYPKVSRLSHNEIYAYNNKHSLRSNTKGYGSKSHSTDSQNSNTTAPSGRDLYHLQFSVHAASPETLDTPL